MLTLKGFVLGVTLIPHGPGPDIWILHNYQITTFLKVSVKLQRRPIWLIWDGWRDKEPRGIVVDLNKMGIVHGSITIALDVWMLLLPLTQLYKLNLGMKKKLGVIDMFGVGILQVFPLREWKLVRRERLRP
ncbi:hypothetical protein LZ30DRAFT_688447 [Colletotrichum cereale]|nr:hypothetical protein LZ30DRAFT_688447 [Colletotrichum cereale]